MTITVEVVWFSCWDCGLDGLYPSDLNHLVCPDCDGLMLQVHKHKRTKTNDDKDRDYGL